MNIGSIIKDRCWCTYFSLVILLATMSSLKYYNLNSTVFDLGVFLNNFYLISEGYWDRLFLSHIQPLNFVWSLFYKVLPSSTVPIFILIGQASLLALPIIGLYRVYGPIPTIAFVLYFPLWYNALFDFHIDHLAIPFLFGFLMMEKKGKVGLAVCFGLLLALVKEIFAIQAVFCGLYLLLVQKQRLGGMILTLASLIYFFISWVYLKNYFNPSFVNIIASNGDIQTGPYTWLGSSFNDVASKLFTQPHWVLGEVFSDKERLKYLFYIFGALGFIPLLRPGILLITIPILAHSLLSSEPKHYGFTHHYSAGLLIPNVIAFAEGLPKAKNLWEYARFEKRYFETTLFTGLLVCHILLSPSPIGRKFYSNKSWNYHYSVYLSSERNKTIKNALKTHIPSNPDKSISMQNSLNFSHLIERKNFKLFPHGAVEKAETYEKNLTWLGFIEFVRTKKPPKIILNQKFVDYVILDLKRPWFDVDQGCHWIAGKCENGARFENRFLKLIKKTKKNFNIIFEQDGFMILKLNSLKTSP